MNHTKDALSFFGILVAALVGIGLLILFALGPSLAVVDLLFEDTTGHAQAAVGLGVMLLQILLCALAVGIYQDWRKK